MQQLHEHLGDKADLKAQLNYTTLGLVRYLALRNPFN